MFTSFSGSLVSRIPGAVQWAVVKGSPWHLVGVYATKEVAETKAKMVGDGYEVHYGSYRKGSDDFVWSEQ
ncbi:hypothetical protein QP337_25265 [Escherichia coli]|nr:hypothetical protein [Escherichia coli]